MAGTKPITFRTDEIDALIFAAEGDLETVVHVLSEHPDSVPEWIGQDEVLMSAIQKLEEAK